ncbi:hypothetical protein HHI36_004326 [Cryptolaemus montrouzieri]|uniref:GRIP domain-containing protein n=1 Tax=Cryptolaemus montrouzieri TaxID=559131 RepID=A0ABD2NRJ1_9CUCU
MLKLVREIEVLTENSTKLQQQIDEFKRKEEQHNYKLIDIDIQTDEYIPEDVKEEIQVLRSENSQLLIEMNEMNQELKERGENLSKLQAHCDEIKKKIQIYETQANKNINNLSEKEETIKALKAEIEDLKMETKDFLLKDQQVIELKNEIEALKEQINSNDVSNYAESDIMSTSTISRTEESERLKDLEGSWEEKYNKLRNLAIKLKAKLRDQTVELNKEKAENLEMQLKFNRNFDSLKALQSEYDLISEELESSKNKCLEFTKQLEINERNSNSKDDDVNQLKIEIDNLKKDKTKTETWKKQISIKVQALRKELEEKESNLSKLNAELEAKEQALKLEIESHRQTKNSLQHSTNENKKNTVLNLEMQDYEKSVKDLSQKLERKNDQITKLKGQVDSQKITITALREQSVILEEKIRNHESDLDSIKFEANAYKKKNNDIENVLQVKEDEILALSQQLETIRSQNEELSTELSKDIAERQKIINNLREEKESLYLQNFNLQQSNKDLQQKLSLKEEELATISSEYEIYKIRAQSVLRQNQSRDIGLEEKLTGNVTSLTSQIEVLHSEMKELRNLKEILQKENENYKAERNTLISKHEEVSNEISEVKSQYDKLLEKYNQTLDEHNETVRSLKIHAETLGQCYRQQITEQEVRHNREIVELQSKLEKAPSPTEVVIQTLPTMPREEGEGSESTESINRLPVPLEKLLSDGEDLNIGTLKRQINEQESKLKHLTELLADTEQDLAKHVQMNKVLKEEIRRQQRAVEREKHAENLEYLKNVMFKFITSNNGDERNRLVPVLNTILKLSPEETQKLNMVAKGDPGLKAWSSYLGMWSSPSNK